MITIGYKILFTIKILHSYYSDWKSRDLVIIPTEKSLQFLKNYNLLYRQTEDGILVLARVIDNNGTLKIPISKTEGFKLSFHIYIKTKYFINLTNLPLQLAQSAAIRPAKNGYYFSNLSIQEKELSDFPTTPNPTFKLLTKNPNGAVAKVDSLSYVPSIFKAVFNPAKKDFKLAVKDVILNESPPPYDVNEAEEFNEYQINLSKIPKGLQTLILDGTEIPVYLSDSVFQKAPFGIIEVFHNTTTGIISDTNQVQGLEYTLYFENRSVFWKYSFSGAATSAHTINNFTKSENPLEYISNSVLPLKDTYQSIEWNSKKLPNPDGKIIKPKDQTHYISEVYL